MKTQHKQLSIAIMVGVVFGFSLVTIITFSDEEPPDKLMVRSVEMNNRAIEVTPDNYLQASTSKAIAKLYQEQLQHNQNQLHYLEQRVDQLAVAIRSEEDSNETAAELEAQTVEMGELTPEKAQALELEWWENTRAAFEQEAVDPEWAYTTQQLFEADVAQLAEKDDFFVVETECRTTQCAVTLQWPSYDKAALGFTHLLHHTYEANCERYTLLPEPNEEDAGMPYEMTLIFNCSG